jgi:flagellar assembly protein FliH
MTLMPNNQTLTLRQPLREVTMAVLAAFDPMEHKIREREQAAYERGRREGEKAVQEQLETTRNEAAAVQQGVLESLRQCVPKVVRECEQTLTELCLEAARKLVSGIPISVEMVAVAIKEAMTQVNEAADYEIYLHPEDLALLKGADSQLLVQSNNGPKLHFHSSDEVSRGGCVLKTRFGIIDGRRETRFELLKKTVLS